MEHRCLSLDLGGSAGDLIMTEAAAFNMLSSHVLPMSFHMENIVLNLALIFFIFKSLIYVCVNTF